MGRYPDFGSGDYYRQLPDALRVLVAFNCAAICTFGRFGVLSPSENTTRSEHYVAKRVSSTASDYLWNYMIKQDHEFRIPVQCCCTVYHRSFEPVAQGFKIIAQVADQVR